MRIRKIDFDPPPPPLPPPPQQPQHHSHHPGCYFDNYDVREYNHSLSTIDDDSDRAYIHVNNNNSSHHHHPSFNRKDDDGVGGDDDIEFTHQEEEQDKQEQEQQQEEDCDAVSITWSNAPGIEVDSPKSDSNIGYFEVEDIEELQHHDSSDDDDHYTKETRLRNNNNDIDITIYNDDEEEEEEDESSSIFLSWPQLPELPLTTPSTSLPQQQHEQIIKQRCRQSVSSSSSERPPWFLWGRRASDSNFILNTSHLNNRDVMNNGGGHNHRSNSNNNTNKNGDKNGDNNNNIMNKQQKSTSSDDDDNCLVPTNQQWWQFGRRRNTFDSYAGGGRKSSAVTSNVQNSGRWQAMESFMGGGGGEDNMSSSRKSSSARSSSAGSNVNSDSTLVIDNRQHSNNSGSGNNNNSSNSSAEKSTEMQLSNMPLKGPSTAENNNSSFTSSGDGDNTRPKPTRLLSNTSITSSVDGETTTTTTRPKPTRLLSRRKIMDGNNNNSFTSTTVDDEVNDWLFPRRGVRRSSSITYPNKSPSNNTNNPPQSNRSSSQQDDDDGVEGIVDKLKKSSVDVSPIDRMLLKDMASSKNSNRWRNRSSIVGGADGNQHCSSSMMDLGASTFSLQTNDEDGPAVSREEEEAHQYPQAAATTNRRELNNSLWCPQHGVPEVYWDSDKISQMKEEGVSLARAKALDEVSSIASSDHSGKITKRKHLSKRRLSFTSSFFGWSSTINEEETDDDCSFKPDKIPFNPERIVPRGTSGKLSSMKSSIRPKSMVMSTPPSLLSKARRRASIDYDDYDDDEMFSVKNPLAVQDLKHETVVKEANEIMTSVNNSVIAMGMNAPFRPMEEICPSFQKLHKNLGYQMDALNAAIVRTTTTKSPINNKRQGLKKSKSKKLKTSNFKQSSQFSMSSGNSLTDSSNQSSTNSILNDSEAMSKFILYQMALLQSQQTGDGSSITTNVTPRSFYTSWLPNYMWYQTIAGDASSVMRPTSLCSGTGITRDEQYLNPEMLKVFEMFSTYFVGSKHLFQEEDEDNDDSAANMRRSYWMDTIEEIDSADESSEKSTSSDSELSEESDMVYELGEVGSADIDQFVDTEKQIEILQTVINDLRKSRLNDRPFVSIEASAPGPESNLSSSTSTDERNTSSRDSNLTSSTITNEMNTSGRDSNFTSSTLTQDI